MPDQGFLRPSILIDDCIGHSDMQLPPIRLHLRTKMTVHEDARETVVRGTYDVVIAGGGIAGVAAAVSAARRSLSACLVEKQCAFGGLATLGNVAVFLPLCDGRGNQVIGGIAEELLRLSVTDNELPQPWRSGVSRSAVLKGPPNGSRVETRFMTTFNPASFLLALDDFVDAAGVHVLFDARVCGAAMVGDRIEALIAEGKDGRFAVRGGTFIDATGDADLARAAGEPISVRRTNVAAGWFYTWGPPQSGSDGAPPALQKLSRPFDRGGAPMDTDEPAYSGCSPEDVTAFSFESRRLMRSRLEELAAAVPYQLPAVPSFRMTRRIVGQAVLTEAMESWSEDTVAAFGSWRERGPVYPLPLSCLRAGTVANLLAVGRCLAADGIIWDLTRAIPVCALSGEIAGIMCERSGELSPAPSVIRDRIASAGGIPAAPPG